MKNLAFVLIVVSIFISSCNKNDDQQESNDMYYLSDDICECSNQEALQIINNDTIWIPNAITPNGDGLNDRFRILGIEKIIDNSIRFMDRNNNVLIQFSPFTDYWDGTYILNGSTVTADNGKYYFEITAGGQTIKRALLLISSNDLSESYFDIKPSESDCDIIAGLLNADDPIFIWK